LVILTPKQRADLVSDLCGSWHGCHVKNHESAIQDLVARYCDALVRADEAAWAETWAEDAVWDLGGFVVAGRGKVVDLWRQATAPFACIVQVASNPMIRVHDDAKTAHGRWTVVEHLATADGSSPTQTVGIYDDDYKVVGGEWLFAKRRFQPVFTGPHDLVAPPNGYPTIAALS
jgi:ketosteroid isomerase-like protein